MFRRIAARFAKSAAIPQFRACRTNPEANHKSVARFLSKRDAQILQIGCLLLDAYHIDLAQECDAACRSSAFVACKCQQNHSQVYTRHKTLQNSSRPTTYCYHLGHLWAEVNQQTYFWTHDQGFIYTVYIQDFLPGGKLDWGKQLRAWHCIHIYI